jgi:hypothetical protein
MPDPVEFVFSALNQPFAPADCRNADELTRKYSAQAARSAAGTSASNQTFTPGYGRNAEKEAADAAQSAGNNELDLMGMHRVLLDNWRGMDGRPPRRS